MECSGLSNTLMTLQNQINNPIWGFVCGFATMGVDVAATWCWENIGNSGKFVLHFYLPFCFLVQLMLAIKDYLGLPKLYVPPSGDMSQKGQMGGILFCLKFKFIFSLKA